VVLHDLRVGSPTDGATETLEIGDHDDRGVFIPPGVAHGFSAQTDVVITYLVDGYYNPADELGVAWDDPEIGADWGITDPVLSNRDQGNPKRSAIPPHLVPRAPLRT
jgi:dTDP-4-dehydrorhamnose 3,5-epimerase